MGFIIPLNPIRRSIQTTKILDARLEFTSEMLLISFNRFKITLFDLIFQTRGAHRISSQFLQDHSVLDTPSHACTNLNLKYILLSPSLPPPPIMQNLYHGDDWNAWYHCEDMRELKIKYDRRRLVKIVTLRCMHETGNFKNVFCGTRVAITQSVRLEFFKNHF